MRYSKLVVWAVMAAGIVVTGAQAKAQEHYAPSREFRQDQREFNRDHARVNELRNDIARHRAKLADDLRFRRTRAAAQERREIAREEALLASLTRDMRHDRH